MPFTAEQLAGWVGTLGLPDDKKKIMLETLGDDTIRQKVGDSVLAQSEFTRRMDELKNQEATLKADFERKDHEVNNFRGTLTKWKEGKEQTFKEAVAAKEAADARLASIRSKMSSLSTTYGIPETEINPLFEGSAAVVPEKKDQQRDDDGRFVSNKVFESTMENAALIPAILSSIEREHTKLFPGQDIDLVQLVKDAQKGNVSLKAQWENQFKVSDRRAAVGEEKIKERIAKDVADAVAAERSRIMAENPNMGIRAREDRSQFGSPVLQRARVELDQARKDGKSVADGVDEGRGVAAAVAAWNTGKYKEGQAA